MVGSAIQRALESQGVQPLIRDRASLDLTRQLETEDFFSSHKIDQVYLAAARVGGIRANDTSPADFITENLQIQTNVIAAAHAAGVSRLLFLGSSCIYPRLADQPMAESALLTGLLEPTNEPYAIAKIAGIKMCESFHRQYGRDFRSIMPTNLYGPNDNFDLESSHVLAALLRKFHEAVTSGAGQVTVWGSGEPRREFLHVDDLASAAIHIMNLDTETYWASGGERCSHVNVGCGEDTTIADLALLIAEITGFRGEIVYDRSKPDGTPRKLLDVSRMTALGWQASISLREGIQQTYEWMVQEEMGSE